MKLKAILYSGGQTAANQRLHQELGALVGPQGKFTYVAFCTPGAKTYFQRAVRRYSAHGIRDFRMIAPDSLPDRKQLLWALKSDVVYLAGGNTFYFLYHLRRSGMLPLLRQYARDGGILAGLSAGALLLTPSIQLAGYPEFDRDENEVGLKNLQALGLVPFEFFPHDRQSPRLTEALVEYSKRCRYPILGCRDGSGVVFDQGKWKAVGDVRIFHRGGWFWVSRDIPRR